MMLVKWLLLLSTIPMIIIPDAYARLQELPISDSSSVSERTMMSILESCYDDDSLSGVVVVVGDFNAFTDKLQMIRINSKDPPDHPFKYLKWSGFIIVSDSLPELEINIELLKMMQWWNHMASFFIIGKNAQSCKNVFKILSRTWIGDMINSIYICPESMNTSVLYTANPYTNYAPHPWESRLTHNGTTYFRQRFDKNASCKSLNYDKTMKLNGHRITAMALKFSIIYPDVIRNDNLPVGMISAVVNALNINYIIYIVERINLAFESLYLGSTDLVLPLSSIEKDPTTKFLFPYSQDRIVAVIKSSPEKSIQRKILHLWNFSVIFLAFIALAILFLILSWKNHEFSSAFLDIIRLIIHSSILANIRSNSCRIFFTTILIMMSISNRIFEGRMATFLTTREQNAPIERIETLIQLGYKLYSTPGLEELIETHCPECHPITVEHDDCFTHVLEEGLTACLTEESVYQHVSALPFELVKEPLIQTFLVTKCRDNWPLYDRMNDMWMRIFESGLRQFWERQKIYWPLQGAREVQDITGSSAQYRPIKLDELWFAFAFLIIGLSLSTLVFIAELLVKKYGGLRLFNRQVTDS